MRHTWNVWLYGRRGALKVRTEHELPAHAVAAAMDQVGQSAGGNAPLRARRVELLDDGGVVRRAWGRT